MIRLAADRAVSHVQRIQRKHACLERREEANIAVCDSVHLTTMKNTTPEAKLLTCHAMVEGRRDCSVGVSAAGDQRQDDAEHRAADHHSTRRMQESPPGLP